MKIISPLILLLALISCSSKKPKVSPDEYLKLNKAHKEKHNLCIQHRSQILEKPITVVEEAELNDELYFFVRNEEKALFYIDNFDISKFTLKENQQEFEAIIQACVMERDPNHKTCETLMPAYQFFRGLIYGMNQFRWTPATINKAKDITWKYLEYVGKSDSSLMDVLLANDLLLRLSQRGYVDKALHPKTIAFKKEGEQAYKDLRKEIKKLGKKELTCVDVDAFYSIERKKVIELSHKFLEILNGPK